MKIYEIKCAYFAIRRFKFDVISKTMKEKSIIYAGRHIYKYIMCSMTDALRTELFATITQSDMCAITDTDVHRTHIHTLLTIATNAIM